MGNIIIKDGLEISIGAHKGKKIIIGSDHRGFDHKNLICDYLNERKHHVIDVGTFWKKSCDYPEISYKIGYWVSKDYLNTVGIAICGSGMGILMSAAKHKGVYAARCLTIEDAVLSRRHNNANVLGLSANNIKLEDIEQYKEMLKMVEAWISTPFYESNEDERHLERFALMRKQENALIKRGFFY